MMTPATSGGASGLSQAAADLLYAAIAHNHAATDITSGTMATARLGSGTANSTTFLRGDSTWATPSGGTTFADNVFAVQDNGDASKQLMFEVSGVSVSTIRTATVPNRSFTFDTITTASTLTLGATGRIPFQSSSGLVLSNANFNWSEAQGGLGIGGAHVNGTALSVAATTTNAGLYATAVTGLPLWCIQVGTTGTTDVTTVARITRNNASGTPGAAYGSAIEFCLESSTTENTVASQIRTVWETATHASRTSNMQLQLVSSAGALATYFTFKPSGLVMAGGLSLTIGSTIVIGPTATGWTAATGTHNRGAYATYEAPDIEATYTEATIQAMADALQALSRRVYSLETDLGYNNIHGLIGT